MGGVYERYDEGDMRIPSVIFSVRKYCYLGGTEVGLFGENALAYPGSEMKS